MKPTFSRRKTVSSASPRDEVETPPRKTSPEVGKSIAPARFRSVDLPHPLRPTKATNSPGETSSVIASSARTVCPSLRYSLLTDCRDRIGICSVADATPDASNVADETDESDGWRGSSHHPTTHT